MWNDESSSLFQTFRKTRCKYLPAGTGHNSVVGDEAFYLKENTALQFEIFEYAFLERKAPVSGHWYAQMHEFVVLLYLVQMVPVPSACSYFVFYLKLFSDLFRFGF